MCGKVLNITNGEYFNEYFVSAFGGVSVPFCEAMMDGDAVADIYSDQFVEVRAGALNVSENEYRAKMYVYDAMSHDEYQKLCLWFGGDTFCQVNLLTLLAYLEQIGFKGEVWLNYIDDETFEVLQSDISVTLGRYSKLYEEVLIFKYSPCDVGVLCAEAIDLYFDYHSDDGKLTALVRDNADMEKTELICLLLENSKEYGLSDIQAERIIEKIKLSDRN